MYAARFSALERKRYQRGEMKGLLLELKAAYDYVMIDCPAGIEQGFKNAIVGADEAVVICTPEVASIRDADKVIGLLGVSDVAKTSLVVNRMKEDLVKRGDMLGVEDIEDILGIKAIGIIPEDELVVRAANLGEPVVNIFKSGSWALPIAKSPGALPEKRCPLIISCIKAV